MPDRNTELFIARRLSSDGGGTGRSIMVRIATVSVAIGVAVVIVALAVIWGFKDGITSKLTGFGGHVQITRLDGNVSFETSPMTLDPALEHAVRGIRNFGSIHPYAQKGGVLKAGDQMQGIVLKGVGADYDWGFFTANLVAGELPQVADTLRNKDILISSTLAAMMKTGVGDRVEVLFIREGATPRRDRYKVCGIYDTGFDEMDKLVVVTDIRNVRRINNWAGDQVSGYEVNTLRFGELDDFAVDVERAVLRTPGWDGEILTSTSLKSRYPSLFDWLETHNVNAAVIMVIMLLVALLNMSSTLLIILLERTQMIGILKAVGMTNRSLQRVFRLRSLFIVMRGVVWGNIVGLGLCALQYFTHAVPLDRAAYFLAWVPVKIEWGWIVLFNFATFAVILIVMALPLLVVSRVSPETTMRYQ